MPDVPACLARMICVAGSPRSGTTWVGKTFDSHPESLYRHEPDLTYPPRDLPLLVPVSDYDRYRDTALSYLSQIMAARDPKTSGILPVFRKSYHGGLDYQLRRHSVVASKLLKRLNLNLSIPDLVDHRDVSRVRLVWKTIESLGRIGLLAHALPDARFVHVVRHPCGHIASTLRGERQHRFSSSVGASEDLGLFAILLQSSALRQRGIDEPTLKSMSAVQRLAVRWLAVNEQLMLDTRECANVRSVAYESICDNPVGLYKELFAFCELQWPAQSEAFLQQSTSRDSSGYYSVIKDPAKAANKWRDELSTEQVGQIMGVVRDSLPGRLFPNSG